MSNNETDIFTYDYDDKGFDKNKTLVIYKRKILIMRVKMISRRRMTLAIIYVREVIREKNTIAKS